MGLLYIDEAIPMAREGAYTHTCKANANWQKYLEFNPQAILCSHTILIMLLTYS